eukprot:5839099-Pleurochrysis_carterae.AAC.1
MSISRAQLDEPQVRHSRTTPRRGHSRAHSMTRHQCSRCEAFLAAKRLLLNLRSASVPLTVRSVERVLERNERPDCAPFPCQARDVLRSEPSLDHFGRALPTLSLGLSRPPPSSCACKSAMPPVAGRRAASRPRRLTHSYLLAHPAGLARAARGAFI